MLQPLIKSITYSNLLQKYKLPAKFHIQLTANPDDPIFYMEGKGNSKKLEGFRDPNTGLYITNSSLQDHAMISTKKALSENKAYHGPTSAIGALHSQLFHEMEKNIALKINELEAMRKQNPQTYDNVYKPLDVISMQLYQNLDDVRKFMTDIYGQLRAMPDRNLPTLNSNLLYADSDIDCIDATCQLPYDDPTNQKLTEKEKKLVESFLSVFFDQENLSIFSWMMGAVFLNKPIHTSNISRFFLLYSKNGGVGKSTVMRLITEGLLTVDYADLVPEFDRYFLLGDKFGSSSMTTKRLVIYDEAVFNGPMDHDKLHNFNGINEAAIKTFATSGQLDVEEKFKQKHIEIFNNIHVILTNFLPVVPANRTDLGRRFLDCQLKPTTMQEKAKQLNDMTVAQMVEYVHKHGQAFINYFANEYLSDPTRYKNYMYSHEVTADNEQDALDLHERKLNDKKHKLQSSDIYTILNSIHETTNADIMALINDIRQSIPSSDYISNSTRKKITFTSTDNKNIHFEYDKETNTGYIYLNASTVFFSKYPNGLAIRNELLSMFPRVKRFSQRTIKLPLPDNFNTNIN